MRGYDAASFMRMLRSTRIRGQATWTNRTESCPAGRSLASLSTADQVDSRIGALEFTDGAPTAKTVETLYDHLDFVHGLNAFLTAFPAASTQAIRQGFLSVGVQDNTVLIFSELMDSSSRFLTANADTVYYLAFVDLSDGPMVVETPPMALGTFDDMWFQWIIDFGLPGPDRGAGGKFLLVPPGYDGPLPEGGFYVGHSRTNRVLMLGPVVHAGRRPRADRRDHQVDPQDLPVHAGRPGHQRRHPPRGRASRSRRRPDAPETTFVEGSGLAFNTIPPTDAGFFETVHALLQDEPVDAADPEIVGHLAEVGVVKGKPFAPDDRMRRILDDAATVGNATSRALMFDARGEEDVACYPDSAWTNMLFGGGYLFDRPIPRVTPEGIKPYPPTGARKHDLRTLFFYGYTGITPAMAMRLTGHRQPVPRARSWTPTRTTSTGRGRTRVTLPPDIPQARFWSLTLYDNQTRSMLVDAPALPAGREPVVPDPRGRGRRRRVDHASTSAPSSPPASPDGNWIQTMPGKGYFVDPPALQPAPAVLRQVLAGRRVRARVIVSRRRRAGSPSRGPWRWATARCCRSRLPSRGSG